MSKDTLHIYTRVSTTKQEEGGSLEEQKETGIRRAKSLGMKYKIWNEGGRSSRFEDLDNRPVLNDLLMSIEEGDIQYLYVWNTDRLSRNTETFHLISYRFLKKHNVKLYHLTGEFDLNDMMSELFFLIMTGISQYDNKLRTKRLTDGKYRKVREDGNWKGGTTPYGYDLVDKKLVINEEESKWVKFIYESYKDGSSINEIRTQLLQNGVLTKRGKPTWGTKTIDDILTNQYFDGKWTMTPKDGETIKVSCPRILDSKLIKEVRELREKRSYKKTGGKRKTVNVRHFYLVKDLLVCGHCGSGFGGRKMSGRVSYYQCLSKEGDWKVKGSGLEKNCRGKRRIRIDTTDDLIWDTVIDVVTNSKLFKESVKEEMVTTPLVLDPKNRKVLENKVKKLTKESEDVEQSIVKLTTTMIVDKKDKDRTQSIINNLEDHKLKLESQIEDIDQKLNQSQTNKEWIDWVSHFGKKVDQLRSDDFPDEEKQKFLEGLVHHVEVINTDLQTHELTIDFKLPYVGDRLKWNDENKKSMGYKIVGGKKTKVVRSNLLKKLTT